MRDIMEIQLFSPNCDSGFLMLPTSRYEIQDVLDRHHIPDNFRVRIESCDEVPELALRTFNGSELDKLQILAQRIKDFQDDYCCNKFAYRALVQDLSQDADLDTLIKNTFNLDGIPVYPCMDDEEYGEIVLENEMLDELTDISDEVYEMIDRSKAGKIMRERENGVFIDGYYIVKSSYEPIEPEEISLPPVQEWLVRIGVKTSNGVQIELQLPLTENPIGQGLADYTIEWVDSFIPGFDSRLIKSADQIPALNDIAKKLSELSREDFVKFKAICDSSFLQSTQAVDAVLQNLDNFEFDNAVHEISDYGKRFLSKMLPPDFDRSILSHFDSYAFSNQIAYRNCASLTNYGMISMEGKGLYAMPEATPEQDEAENFDIKM